MPCIGSWLLWLLGEGGREGEEERGEGKGKSREEGREDCKSISMEN